MPRYPRNFSKTCFFHIITQGINKSYIFNKDDDIKYYIKLMYLLKKEHNIEIIAYCVMNNHAHILIKTEEINELSKYMQRLNIRYGIYYNKKYNRVGYVFRDRFKSQGIYNEKQLHNCIIYIYDNPVKAGICRYAKDYIFSNYKEIKGCDEKNDYFIDIEEDIMSCSEIIKEYIKEKNLSLEELKKDRNELKILINKLHCDNKISLREIAKELDMAREKIRIIYNN